MAVTKEQVETGVALARKQVAAGYMEAWPVRATLVALADERDALRVELRDLRNQKDRLFDARREAERERGELVALLERSEHTLRSVAGIVREMADRDEEDSIGDPLADEIRATLTRLKGGTL